MIKRTLDLTSCKNSLFLFGPRQTGKTYLIQHTLRPDIYIDLLKQGEQKRYANDVSLLSKEAARLNKRNLQIVIDEIQRCPELLNEAHLIMEQRPDIQFIMTGSSARKLRRAGVNLLGGRAVTFHLHPFTHQELGDLFPLEDALRFGTLPKIALEENRQAKIRLLKSYVETYLKEEIQQEALTRNVPAFSRFLDLAGFENSNILNFNNVAREVGVHSKTIKEYFQILEDTLVGFFLDPYARSHRKKLVLHPKFYLFDCGLVSALQQRLSSELTPGTPPYGLAFEHFLILEIKRLIDYREREVKISFFRTTDGAEVDVVLEREQQIWAIEVKASSAPGLESVRGLRSFMKDHKYHRAICACLTPRAYTESNIEFLPWNEFLKEI